MHSDESKKKLRGEIIAVIAVAVIIVVVASIFVAQYIIKSSREQKLANEISKQISEQLDENSKQASEIRSKINPEIAGTYISAGDANSDDPASVIISLQLIPDGSVAAKNMNGDTLSGWWSSYANESTEFVAVGFSNASDISMYQVYNSYLIDMRSVYYGHVENSSAFDTTLVSSSDKGEMTIELSGDGKATADFIDTNEDSENYGLKYIFSGRYTVDGDFMDITLNSAHTRFVMFDYGISGTDADSGIASIYYQKQ
ncbi:MAG: hypothetical protein IKA95_02020 [Clostridia bacterium]|nr:hypothetical protein [Clostridia bacterium]